MATILNAYDVTGGEELSSEVATPNNVRLHWEWSGATKLGNQYLATLQWLVSDGTEYVALKDEKNKPIQYTIRPNTNGSTNVLGINSASLKINVIPATGSDGSLTLTTYES